MALLKNLPGFRSGFLFLAFVFFTAEFSGASTSFIQTENAKPGDASWHISNPANHHEIEGYASAPSINRGESITFFVSTASPNYTLEIYRMGWYGGAGARKMQPTVTLGGIQQPLPLPDPVTGLIECNWTPSYVLQIPDDVADPTNWMSGIYLVKLTALDSGKERYMLFVVRDDARASDVLFQNSVTTHQAYNAWGGLSLYTQPRAFKVSFNRPFLTGAGAGDFIGWGWENHMLRFLEREGYDVSYTTDVDTHARGALLLQHKAFLSVGHDEYWSSQMRDNVEQARDNGVSLGFFGANAAYWQVRFEPSTLNGEPNRTMVCYKSATLDPITQTGNPADLKFATTKFRLPPVNRPENTLIGVMYESGNIGQHDLIIFDSSNWLLEGTGLQNGDRLEGMLGYEADRMFTDEPRGIQSVMHSPYLAISSTNEGCATGTEANCVKRFSDFTTYNAESGATVVATGTMHWNWGLDAIPPNPLQHPNPNVQQIMRNILHRFLNPPPYYLEPRTIAYPPQLIGTVKTQQIVIVNHRTTTLAIDHVNQSTRFTTKNMCPKSLDHGARCTIEVNYVPTAVGDDTGNISISLAGDSQDVIGVPLLGIGSDFRLLSDTSSQQKMIPGSGSAEFQLTLNSLEMIGNIDLSCDGGSPELMCLVVPASVTFHGSDSKTIKVFILNAPSGVASTLPSSHYWSPDTWDNVNLAVIASLVFLFAAQFVVPHKKWRAARAFVLAGVIGVMCVSCGQRQAASPSPNNPTPLFHQFRINAISEGIVRSADIQLQLQ